MAAIPASRTFHSGPVEIAYLDEGAGDPIVLVHGFASNKETNWVHPGWVTTLTRAGYRVVAPDNRGHGASSKPHDPADYHTELMAADVVALLDHLGIATADLMGYSMGARIAAFCAVLHPRRVRSVVLGGLGIHLVEGVGLPESIAYALEADSLDDVNDPIYFHQVVERAARHGLEYLAESDLLSMMPVNFPAEATQLLNQLAGDEKERIARGFEVEPAAVHLPNQ